MMGRHEPIVNVVEKKSQKDPLFKTVIIKTCLTPQCLQNFEKSLHPNCLSTFACVLELCAFLSSNTQNSKDLDDGEELFKLSKVKINCLNL